MTSLINHLQSVRYSHSLFSTSYWQCHLHTSLLCFGILFFYLRLLLHVNHVQPICTFPSCTVMLILIFKSTVYCHAHILYFVLYIFFFFHLILCILLCVVFYNICTVHGADLTHISLLVIYSLYSIIVYVTNKSWTWTWTWAIILKSHSCFTFNMAWQIAWNLTYCA